MEKEFEPSGEQADPELLADELALECEQCKAIQEEMSIFFEADGLTYTHPDKEDSR